MGGNTHHDNINAQLSGFFTNQTPPATGSYAFDEADMRAIVKNWLDLADSYDKSVTNAVRMGRIKPPAEDFASLFHTKAANRSGESYREYVEHNRDYCVRQAQLFQDALDDYLGVEHTNVTEMHKTGPQGPQGGV